MPPTLRRPSSSTGSFESVLADDLIRGGAADGVHSECDVWSLGCRCGPRVGAGDYIRVLDRPGGNEELVDELGRQPDDSWPLSALT